MGVVWERCPPLSDIKGEVKMTKNVDAVNVKISEYEDALRDAETAIENACRAICSLRGNFPRYELRKALEGVQNALRNAWRFYDNPEIEIAR